MAPGTPVTVGLRLNEEPLVEVTIQIQGRAPVKNSLEYGEGCEDDDWKDELQSTMRMAESFLSEYREYIEERAAKSLEGDLDRGQRAFDAENRREGRMIGRRITKEVLYSDDMGNLLFQAERLARVQELSEEVRERLSVICLVAKQSHRDYKAQPTRDNDAGLQEAKKDLEIAISLAFRGLPKAHEDDSLLEDRS